MAEPLCPKCGVPQNVQVKQSRTEKGKDIKYFECAKCHALWTNSIDIAPLPLKA